MTVEELREELIKLGLTPEEAEAIKGKSNILNKIEEIRVGKESEEMFDNAQVVEEHNETLVLGTHQTGVETEQPESCEKVVPSISSPAWQDYVLSHLQENEKIKGHPKADSLRRLTELLLGPIVNIDTQVPQCPDQNNNYRATVIVSIDVETTNSLDYNGLMIRASGAADVFPGNTEQLFAKFPVATAETRAEGRAYRKLLRLVNIVTAEELVDENQIYDPTDRIDTAQIMMIKQMCSTNKLNINVEELLSKYNIQVDSLEKISKSKAQEICKILSSYQATGVPEELLGYQENWML